LPSSLSPFFALSEKWESGSSRVSARQPIPELSFYTLALLNGKTFAPAFNPSR